MKTLVFQNLPGDPLGALRSFMKWDCIQRASIRAYSDTLLSRMEQRSVSGMKKGAEAGLSAGLEPFCDSTMAQVST